MARRLQAEEYRMHPPAALPAGRREESPARTPQRGRVELRQPDETVDTWASAAVRGLLRGNSGLLIPEAHRPAFMAAAITAMRRAVGRVIRIFNPHRLLLEQLTNAAADSADDGDSEERVAPRFVKVLQTPKQQLSPQQEKAIDSLRANGNEAYQAGNLAQARRLYLQAISHDPSGAHALAHKLHSNLSAVYASLKDWPNSLLHAKRCVDLDRNFSKGWSRVNEEVNEEQADSQATEVEEDSQATLVDSQEMAAESDLE
ncbi:hypothetical protein EMIHUDRAFT_214030 [Emiliania huxleyi CCMP1516]|uniref:Uncharacterized protein n=2 Tax=Emiliania huxleyi TaxID=2903 RepID=A0A0D3ILR3_EMIH1|nr:hypothetical protein EMIHUDRAFT_214030 [Emiliania huxleyi CCMP1516]EOD12198.1 hypothetical protein EMIHUDRAFT_214030 [Emiliania huxleyi CCMP1516]|eukprot:XP_005764627.1 hypothetical protein EMIHUDRAFT_214030 [Emiliania huxleyi CCMP1516]